MFCQGRPTVTTDLACSAVSFLHSSIEFDSDTYWGTEEGYSSWGGLRKATQGQVHPVRVTSWVHSRVQTEQLKTLQKTLKNKTKT